VYDGSGNETETISQFWGGTDWLNQTRTTNTYPGGIIDETLIYAWLGSWQQSNRITRQYSGTQLDVELFEFFNGLSWDPLERMTCTYNSGRVDAKTTEMWNGLEWMNSNRTRFTSYDAMDRPIEQIEEVWTITTNQGAGAAPQVWQPSFRIVYEYDATTAVSETDGATRPEAFELLGNYPNPFNPSTTISFALNEPTYVSIDVFNALGQSVAQLGNRVFDAGRHEVSWNARDARGHEVGSGVYFYRLQAGDQVDTRKMMLLR
jgi:hypothetical protein